MVGITGSTLRGIVGASEGVGVRGTGEGADVGVLTFLLYFRLGLGPGGRGARTTASGSVGMCHIIAARDRVGA